MQRSGTHPKYNELLKCVRQVAGNRYSESFLGDPQALRLEDHCKSLLSLNHFQGVCKVKTIFIIILRCYSCFFFFTFSCVYRSIYQRGHDVRYCNRLNVEANEIPSVFFKSDSKDVLQKIKYNATFPTPSFDILENDIFHENVLYSNTFLVNKYFITFYFKYNINMCNTHKQKVLGPKSLRTSLSSRHSVPYEHYC